jgi:flagellar basal-body rod protein FlgB
MLTNLTNALDFQSKALVLRAERQRAIASNIANADTPGYLGRDINFKAAMEEATAGQPSTVRLNAPGSGNADGTAHPRHIPLQASTATLGTSQPAYTIQNQPAMDGNSVDMDRERANFVDNAVRYEATLRFINGQSKTILSAIQGQ